MRVNETLREISSRGRDEDKLRGKEAFRAFVVFKRLYVSSNHRLSFRESHDLVVTRSRSRMIAMNRLNAKLRGCTYLIGKRRR